MRNQPESTFTTSFFALGITALGWCLGAFAWSIEQVPDVMFRMGAVVIGLFTVLPMLLRAMADEGHAHRPDAISLLAASVLTASLGLAYTGVAAPWRIALAYLVPAALHFVAAAILALDGIGMAEAKCARCGHAGAFQNLAVSELS